MENTEQLPQSSDSQDKNQFRNAIDFLRRNNKKIENYALIPALAIASLPVAGVYVAKRKGMGSVLGNFLKGAGLTVILTLGTGSYQERDLVNYDFDTVEISHYHTWRSAKETEEGKDFTSGSVVWSLLNTTITNYGFLETLLSPPEYKITDMEVNTSDGKDRIKCEYKFEGFQKPSNIKDLDLKPRILKLDGIAVDGPLGFQTYSPLCEKAFLEAQKRF